MTQENFDLLLGWLDPNRETAARRYETLRQRLIRIFNGRGCFEADDLADRTFDRVAKKLPQILDDYEGERELYFYGVAENIRLEWLREQKKINQIRQLKTDANDAKADEIEAGCLESCLKELSAEQRRLIVGYYRAEKIAKIENRRKLAEDLGTNANGLQVKTFRIRARLKECIKKCCAEKKM